MINGSGVPAIIYNGAVVQLPRPKEGGRESEFTPMNEPYENLDGELVPPETPEWRFEAEYNFAKITNSIIDTLITVYNKKIPVKFVPHIDVPQIAYIVIIDEAKPSDEVYKDGFKLVMRSQKPVRKIPTVDNMISCFQYNHVIVYGG